MKTKKLHSIAFTFLLGVFAFVNTAKSATYYYCGVGSITTASSWWTTAVCGGSHPGNFTHAGDTWNFNTAGSYSLPANWTVGSGAIVNVGFGGTAVTLTTNAFVIKPNTGSNITLNVLGNAVLTVTTSNFFANANKITMATSAGSMVIYSLSGATVGNGTYDNLTISSNATVGGNAITVNNVFNNAAILTLAGGSLDIGGTMSGAGTISGDAAASFYLSAAASGTLNIDQTTPGSTNVMNSVENQGSGTLTLGNALSIISGGDITAVSGTIDVGSGNLTLLASQSSSGAIGDCSGGTLTGSSITSQVYHNPTGNSTNWTTIGVAGVTNANFQQWLSAFPITCASCIDGSTSGGSPFTSVDSYDETQTGGGDYSNAAHYIPLASDANTIVNGQGYWVYMGNSSANTSTAGELISVTGTPAQGSIPLSVTQTNGSNGYNLLANPYPSPISWSSVVTNNPGSPIDGSCYIYNSADGSYCTLNSVGTSSGSYSGLKDDVIPTGMAFYVYATSGSGTLTFDETVKNPGSIQDLERMSSSHNNQTQSTQITRFTLQTLGTNMTGQTMFAFDSRASLGLDQVIDAVFLPGTEPLKVTSIVSGKKLAINGVPNISQNYSIPVCMTTTVTGSYTINGINLQYMPQGPCLILHDNYTNNDYDLRNGPYTITLTDTETVARFVLNVTVTALSITTNVIPTTCPNNSNGFITAIGNNAGPWNYTWKDVNGNTVKTSLNKSTADTLTGLAIGVYNVDVTTVGSCDIATQSFTLTAPSAAASAFTASSNTVNIGSNVVFTNNSTNSNASWWTFGDGNSSNLQSPSYAYTSPGTDTVTLYAINTICGDTGVSTKIITVQATTGIGSSISNGDIVLSKDPTGTFVKFNFSNQTRVAINIYNALGQLLSANTNLTVVNDKIYLNLDNAKDQMIFVSISNLDKNTQVTKKLYNN